MIRVGHKIKKITETTPELIDSVIFVINNGKLDDLFLDSSKSDHLDYENINGDSFYSLPTKYYDRFVDWADSSGFRKGKDFYEVDSRGNQIEENKMKLTTEQKTKIKKFIKNLKESIPVDLQFSNPFKNKRDALLSIPDVLDRSLSEEDFISRLYGARNIGNIEVKDFKLILGQLAMNAKSAKFKFKFATQNVIDKNVIKTNDVYNESKKSKNTLKENSTYTMLSALRDILDDLMLNTEMLIDNKYGKVDHEEFKKEWYRFSNTFENKFKGIQKNLISAAKQKGL